MAIRDTNLWDLCVVPVFKSLQTTAPEITFSALFFLFKMNRVITIYHLSFKRHFMDLFLLLCDLENLAPLFYRCSLYKSFLMLKHSAPLTAAAYAVNKQSTR